MEDLPVLKRELIAQIKRSQSNVEKYENQVQELIKVPPNTEVSITKKREKKKKIETLQKNKTYKKE